GHSLSTVKDESSCTSSEQSVRRRHRSHAYLCPACVPASSSGYNSSLSMCELTAPVELMEAVQGESLLSSVLQVQAESGSVQQQVQEESSSASEVHRESSSFPGCEEFGCFPLDGQVEVWWCQQPLGYLHSPECPAYRLNPFELSGELQVVMFGKTDDQLSLTEQARLYVEP
ncbi:transcriptional activator Myb-like isoform X1, partial [Lates japonicus]